MSIVTRGAWAKPGTSLGFRTGNWRDERPLHHHFTAPCHGACPAGEDPQAWIALIQQGDVEQAWRQLVEANPLPAITGRVCPHPCEQRCNRGQFDEPIAIHALERFLGDEAIKRQLEYPAPGITRAVRMAVVGAGPAGLSAAWHLRREGAEVVLFDAAVAAGGLLRSAIPMTRLPRSVLDSELERVLGVGIEFHPHHLLGRDISIEELETDFDGVFLAPGCQRAKSWSIEGAVPAQLHDGLELLKLWIDHGEVPVAERVVVHGGGNTAMDIARIIKRRGAREVHLITASGLPGGDTAPDDVINVVPRELREGLEEGVQVHPHCTVQRLILRGSRLVGVELASLRRLPRPESEGGGFTRSPFQGTERVLEADMVVPCVGEIVDPGGMMSLLDGLQYLHTDELGRIDATRRIFAGGDARGDRGTVAAAIGDGRLAAVAMLAILDGKAPPQTNQPETIGLDRLNLNYFEPSARSSADQVPVSLRDNSTEIESGLDIAAFRHEAMRCLSCGNCLACDNCWNLCPDNAVIKTVETAADGSHYVFDYEYCKGCGLCAHECPSGFIVMFPEPV